MCTLNTEQQRRSEIIVIVNFTNSYVTPCYKYIICMYNVFVYTDDIIRVSFLSMNKCCIR